MAGIVKLDVDGIVESPLSPKELAYSTHNGELYVGSGAGTASAGSPVTLDPGTEEAGEHRVTRNKELADVELKTDKMDVTAITSVVFNDDGTLTITTP